MAAAPAVLAGFQVGGAPFLTHQVGGGGFCLASVALSVTQLGFGAPQVSLTPGAAGLEASYLFGYARMTRENVSDQDVGLALDPALRALPDPPLAPTYDEERRTDASEFVSTQHELQLKPSEFAQLDWIVGAFFYQENNSIRFDVDVRDDRGPMPGAQLPGRRDVVGQRQDDAPRQDPVAADQHRRIVERRVRKEDVDQELARQVGVDGDAAIGVVLQSRFPLDHHQCAVPLPGQLRRGTDDFVDRPFENLVLVAAERWRAARTSEKAAWGSGPPRATERRSGAEPRLCHSSRTHTAGDMPRQRNLASGTSRA